MLNWHLRKHDDKRQSILESNFTKTPKLSLSNKRGRRVKSIGIVNFPNISYSNPIGVDTGIEHRYGIIIIVITIIHL